MLSFLLRSYDDFLCGLATVAVLGILRYSESIRATYSATAKLGKEVQLTTALMSAVAGAIVAAVFVAPSENIDHTLSEMDYLKACKDKRNGGGFLREGPFFLGLWSVALSLQAVIPMPQLLLHHKMREESRPVTCVFM